MSDSRSARVRGLAVASLILLLVGGASAGPARAGTPEADSSTAPQRFWIFLAPRPSVDTPTRPDRWTQPVAPSYVSSLARNGVDVALRSRWFHAVSAPLSDSLRDAVQTLPFVQTVRPVASLSPATTDRPQSIETRDRSHVLGSSSTRDSSLSLGRAEGPLSRINAVAPLRRGLDGHGVRIGFLDAHFRGLRHPSFTALRRTGRVAGLHTFTDGIQYGNHGAGVASVTAGYAPGTLMGLAHGATVLGATTEYTNYERTIEEDNFVAGLEWLYRKGVDLVNVSVGYTTFDQEENSYSPDDLDGDTAITTRAVDRAAQLGITVVVSAGNSGCASPDSCWFYVNTPADADSAIAVGAVLPDSSLAPFSARGPTADGRRKPDVVVQGRDVVGAWGDSGYAALGGTSFASPQVTGVAAQMLQVNPRLDPMDVRRLLRQTASQAHAPDTTMGWGIVNADAAIRRAEWLARRTPPSSLQGANPYHPVGSLAFVLPVRAPAGTSTLRVTVMNPLGHRVYRRVYAAHPGPNRLTVPTHDLPVGAYQYQVESDTGNRHTGRLTVAE